MKGVLVPVQWVVHSLSRIQSSFVSERGIVNRYCSPPLIIFLDRKVMA
jgi:hypothetical protein